jgi:DNA mismatch repair ATPase MutS
VDRIAAGEAVLRGLLQHSSQRPCHFAIIATHDVELTALVADFLDPWHFREAVDAERLVFDYIRYPGPARTRTALALAAAGAPEVVVDAARNRAQRIEQISRKAPAL